jgi:hypothetical protein
MNIAMNEHLKPLLDFASPADPKIAPWHHIGNFSRTLSQTNWIKAR